MAEDQSTALINYFISSEAGGILEIYSIAGGQPMFEKYITENKDQFSVNLKEFKPGMYLCRLEANDNVSQVKKLVCN